MATVRGVKALLRPVTVALLGVGLLGLAGCDDGSSGPPPDPTSSGTSAGQGPSADGSSGTPTGVPAATGPELHVGVTSLHAPAGFTLDKDQFTSQDRSASDRDGSSVQLFEIRNAADVPDDLRVQAFMESQPKGARTHRLPDVTVGPDQQHALRFGWTFKDDPDRYEAVLFYREGTSVSINFIIAPTADPQFAESVLASVRWL
jgi:hypothetical protein